jgi:hypothetical protein
MLRFTKGYNNPVALPLAIRFTKDTHWKQWTIMLFGWSWNIIYIKEK